MRLLLAVAVGVISACAPMGGTAMSPAGSPTAGTIQAPAVRGFADGEEILFLHTEASDPQVAQMLSDMMRSPVLVVPGLADVPASALATVYVFRNGVQGEGPFGFQPDIFDRPAGRPDYTPLRRVNLVRWRDESRQRLLRSAAELGDAESRGELTIETTSAVVNMPMLTWPGGHR